MRIAELIDMMGKIVTIFGLPLAIFTLLYNGRNAQKAMNLQIVSSFSSQFREKWSNEWRALLEGNIALHQIEDPIQKAKFYDLMNWIDWLGILIQKQAFSDPSLMLTSIDYSLRQAVSLARDEVNSSKPDEWKGVLTVAAWLGMVDDDGKIA